ncbi:MAG: M56 family metallopeptidase [Bacteroidota bacterium]
MPDLVPLFDTATDLAPSLVALVFKVTVFLGIGWGLARLVRGFSAAWRHAVWTGALGAALAVTLLPLALPTWELAVLPGEAAPAVAEGAVVDMTAPAAPAAEAGLPGVPAPPVAPAPPEALPAPQVSAAAPSLVDLVRAHPVGALVLVWALGALAVGGWWFVTALAAWRLAARAVPVKDGAWLVLLAEVAEDLDLRTPVRLLRSERLSVPVTWGAFGPVLILPAEADDWTAERRRAVLAHELAHVRRRDVLWQWVAQLACALHWYQPLAWMAYRRLLAEREHACDDAVLRAGTRPSAYADVLLDVARAVQRREPMAALAMAPMARRSQLEGRLLSILDPSLDRRALSRVLLTVLGAVTLLLAASLATVRPVPAHAAVGDDAAASFAVFAEARTADDARGGDEARASDATGEDAATRSDDARETSRPAGLAVFGSGERSVVVVPLDEDFRWDGVLAPGKQLIVKNVNGAVKADGGNDNRVVIEAEKKDNRGRRSTPASVEVVEFSDGVVVCVRYEGQRGDCSPTESPTGNVNNGVTVDFEVRVPRGVHFEGASVNGAVEALELSGDITATSVNGAVKASTSNGDIEATSVNGAVEASASGSVRASSVNGAIRADMGRADWSGTAEYSSVNGAIILTLPADFSAEVEAKTMNGDIRSDFPLEIRRGRNVGVSASGTVGNGGRRMKLTTQNGSIQLRRSSASLRRAAPSQDRAALRDAELRAAVADTIRSAHRIAQSYRDRSNVHVHHDTRTHADARVHTSTHVHEEGDVRLRIDEYGMRLEVDGNVEVDLDWDDLTNGTVEVVEDALDEVDWDGIADEVKNAFQDVDADVRVEFGAAVPSCQADRLTKIITEAMTAV